MKYKQKELLYAVLFVYITTQRIDPASIGGVYSLVQ